MTDTRPRCHVCGGRMCKTDDPDLMVCLCGATVKRTDDTPTISAQAMVECAWHNQFGCREFKDESEFLAAVKSLALTLGWSKFYHTYRSTRSDPGWVDVVIGSQAHGRVVFAELKMPGRLPTDDQTDWLRTLRAAGCQAYLWYPGDWQTITDTLTL